MRKIFLFMLVCMTLLPIIFAESNPCGGNNDYIGEGVIDEPFTLYQECGDGVCTGNHNISSVVFPNSTILLIEEAMINSGRTYTYQFNDTDLDGCYAYTTYGLRDGEYVSETINFKITNTGEDPDSSQTITVIGMVAVMFLFFGLGRAFGQDKWKIKISFDIMAIIMAVLALNSVRIISVQSSNLSKMNQAGLIVVISMLAFMVMYFLILVTIEVINYFKKKEEMRWEVKREAY